MPKGSLNLHIVNMRVGPVSEKINVEFQPFSLPLGAGGDAMQVSFKMGGETDIIITGISCQGGPETMYRVLAFAPHYRVYSFFQGIREQTVNPASDDIEFWVKPGNVKDIRGPEFDELPPHVRTILEEAEMRAVVPADQDLLGESGESLYEKLGPLRKACLLNLAKKTSHSTSDNCLGAIEGLLLCRQDRFFAFVDESLPDRLRLSPTFKSAPQSLHEPLAGFEMTGESFKTHDAHANLQVTFMRHSDTARLAADIDLDEASGIQHGFEVIRNAVFNKKTNPYLIREFLLSADRKKHSLDPGYDFVF